MGVGVRGADCLHMVQLMPLHPRTLSSLASFKSRLFLPFWYRLTQVALEERQLNGCSVIVIVVVVAVGAAAAAAAAAVHLCLTGLPEVAMPYSDMWQDCQITFPHTRSCYAKSSYRSVGRPPDPTLALHLWSHSLTHPHRLLYE